MRTHLVLLVILLLACLRPASADGAPDFEAARLKSVAANPPGVSLTLSLPGGRTQFHQGEVIPLTAVFASSLPKAYQFNTGPGDRQLPWNSDSFQVDALTGVTDPLRVYYDHEFGEAYSGAGPHFQDLTAQPVLVPYTLNEWLRFDAPGRYRVYLTSGRVINAGGPHQNLFLFHGRATASNGVDLEILPRDPAQDAQTLQQALPLFNADGFDYRTQAARQAAVGTVRFLETPDAVRAMVARYSHINDIYFFSSPAYFQTRLGLFGFPQPAFVAQEMERRIADPDFPVFLLFMQDLAQTQLLATYTRPLPPFAAADSEGDKKRQKSLRERRDALAALTEQDRGRLAAAVPTKRGRARAVSLYTLLQMGYAHQDAAEHRDLARALLPVFDDLTPEEQNGLLDDGGEALLRGPDVLPILRRLCARPLLDPDKNASRAYEEMQIHSLALRRLMGLSPTEGRALLLTEIKSPHPRVDLSTLCSLPDRRLPALDTVLAANLEIYRQNRKGSEQIPTRLVERYGTRGILPRVKAAYGDEGNGWGSDGKSNLLAYFLRTDHAYGVKRMETALASRTESFHYRYILSGVAALVPGLDPDVERLAVLHLHDPDPEVVANAANTLGAYGSHAAEAPLWARMREWRQQWAGKAEQMESTEQNTFPIPRQLEYALAQALATAPGWLADRAKIQALESLCVTEEARRNIALLLPGWAGPIRISFEEARGEWSVAQYGHFLSLFALESKLAQFPRGTRFRLSSWTFPSRREQAQAFGQLKPFLGKRGMQIQMEPLPSRPPR